MFHPRLFAAFAFVVLAGIPARAQDGGKSPVEIPATAVARDSAVTGLRMEFYPFNPDLPKGLDSLDEAIAFISASQPQTAMLLDLPAIDFPKGERTVPDIAISLGDYFFGAEAFATLKASGLSIPPRMSSPIGPRSVFVLRGFIDVKKPGTYKLRAPVDDGAEVKIGGRVVFYKNDFGGMSADDDPMYAAQMTFSKKGLYSIRVTHWDRGNELGIHIFSDLTSPEPGAFVLLPIVTSKDR